MHKIPDSYQFLEQKLGLKSNIPYTKDWSAAADFLEIIIDHCLEARPETIVECSSGLTSLVLARSCQINNQGHLYSLENGEEYADNTRNSLQPYNLSRHASILLAPLTPIAIGQQEYLWYTLESLPDSSIDMLVIDGPPGFIQKHSRYPALPLLFDKLSNHSVIFLDDAARKDEKEIIKKWQTEFPFIKHQYIETERGCSIITIDKPPQE
ncbi:MAG: class I SAM-dependent methyltransferase [Gammaproteobacteria bacterium]|nr:class I SAM-dependent methyltransferase [Gammaproteobacteria bacterium]